MTGLDEDQMIARLQIVVAGIESAAVDEAGGEDGSYQFSGFLHNGCFFLVISFRHQQKFIFQLLYKRYTA